MFKAKLDSSVFATVRRATLILNRRDRQKLFIVTSIQVLSGFLDLLGIALIGALGALVVTGFGAGTAGNRVQYLVSTLGLNSYSFQLQIALIGFGAGILLIFKTLFSVFFTRKTFYFLARRSGMVSVDIFGKLLNQTLLKVQSRSTQEHIFLITTGINTILLGIVGAIIGIIADLSLLIIIACGLFIVDATVASLTLIFFLIIGVLLFWLMSSRASRIGNENADLTVLTNEKIAEVLLNFRESVVRNTRGYYFDSIYGMKLKFSNNLAEMQFMPMISKYVLEASVIIGALLISSLQFVLQNATHAVATLAVFLAAGSRIAPAVMRVQQGAVQVKSSIGAALSTLDYIDELKFDEEFKPIPQELDLDHDDFEPRISFREVTFRYPGNTNLAINKASLNVLPGEIVALVGTSGAGKSTFADLLLGLIEPESGIVEISGEKPSTAIKKNLGAIGYVPQDVNIVHSSIRRNISLGFNPEVVPDEHYWEIIRMASLDKFVEDLPMKLDSQVGPTGSKLSGGQRQRLGIARALFTNPKLIVLDEATSSLDGETELNISKALSNLKGKVTIILIAHRLSTVRDADKVVYLQNGEIKKVGTFNEVRAEIPDFDKQAKLMGL